MPYAAASARFGCTCFSCSFVWFADCSATIESCRLQEVARLLIEQRCVAEPELSFVKKLKATPKQSVAGPKLFLFYKKALVMNLRIHLSVCESFVKSTFFLLKESL